MFQPASFIVQRSRFCRLTLRFDFVCLFYIIFFCFAQVIDGGIGKIHFAGQNRNFQVARFKAVFC